MFLSAAAKRERFVERAEDLGGSFQLEFYKSVETLVKARYDAKFSAKLAGALANYVFRFGLVVADHERDERLMAAVAAERRACLSEFTDIFKTNATGVLILLGAAWQVEFTKYMRHMGELVSLGFAKAGKDTPNVSRELPESDLAYMYEICRVGPISLP